MGKKKDKSKEQTIQKYIKIRNTIKEICDGNNLSCEDYLSRFPVDDFDKLMEVEIGSFIKDLNRDLGLLIRGLFVEEWREVICSSFDEMGQKCMLKMIDETLKGNPADTYQYYSKTNNLLKRLNDESTKEEALKEFEEYCATHSFEAIISNYDWVFRSKHAADAEAARKRGFEKGIEKGNVARKRVGGYDNFFSLSKVVDCESTPREPENY